MQGKGTEEVVGKECRETDKTFPTDSSVPYPASQNGGTRVSPIKNPG